MRQWLERWLNDQQPCILYYNRGWELELACLIVWFLRAHVFVACSGHQPNPHLMVRHEFFVCDDHETAALQWVKRASATVSSGGRFPVKVLQLSGDDVLEHTVEVTSTPPSK